MLLAERAILLSLHSLRMKLLLFRHVVIPLLAFGTCQSNSYAHRVHLQLTIFVLSIFKAQKKEPRPFYSLNKHTIQTGFRQGIFEIFPDFSQDFPVFPRDLPMIPPRHTE